MDADAQWVSGELISREVVTIILYATYKIPVFRMGTIKLARYVIEEDVCTFTERLERLFRSK